MKVLITRFEGNFSVVEFPDMTFVDMLVSLIPEGAEEGDVLSIEIGREKTESCKEKIKKLMDDLGRVAVQI